MTGERVSHEDRLREEAVQWFLDRMENPLSRGVEASFQAWMGACAQNREMFESVEKVWSVAGMGKDDPMLERSRPYNDIANSEYLPSLSDTRDLAEVKETERIRRPLVLGIAALMLTAGLTFTFFSMDKASPLVPAPQTFETALGQRATITLPDGSTVKLDTETELQFHSLINERRVHLSQGRAYFQVAKDASKPFIVHAKGQTVRAIGTAFEVAIEGKIVEVVLAEGEVRVEEAGKPNLGMSLIPGRKLTINPERRWILNQVDVRKETGWTEGRLIFLHDPLSKAIADVNRYSARKLIFKGEQIPDKAIVGTFPAGDVESFIRALELNGIARRVSTTAEGFIMTGKADGPEG